MDGIDPTNLTPVQQAAMSGNILAVELVLGTLLEHIAKHLEHTKGNCPLPCIGVSATQMLDTTDDKLTYMLLVGALRKLCEREMGL